MRHTIQGENFLTDYSITKNLAFGLSPRKNESDNYSLTKPLFLDSHGVVRYSEPVDITDDDSNDPAITDRPQLTSVKDDEDLKMEQKTHDEDVKEKNEDLESELTLNLSPSEGSNKEHLKKLKEEKDENVLEKRRSYLSSELSDDKLILFTRKEQFTPRKEYFNDRKKESTVVSKVSEVADIFIVII